MNVLVTGGAGYIGSVIAARLLATGHAVTVYDDLSRGHRAAVPAGATLVIADIRDAERLAAALTGGGCEAIVHMAALAEVAESVAFPQRYHDVNVVGTQAVLEAALRAGRLASRLLLDGGGLRRARARSRSTKTRRSRPPTRTARPSSPPSGCWARRPPPAAAASPPSRCDTSTRPAPTARAARTTPSRATSCRWRSRRCATAPCSRSSATTTPRPTAPACATTST